MFLNKGNTLSKNGIYGVNLWSLGVPHTVIVDDWLPLKASSDGTPSTMFAKVADDGSLWAPLLEKAFAKYQGNYEHIRSGDSKIAFKTLVGAPSFKITHKQEGEATTVDLKELWEALVEHTSDGQTITAGTPNGPGGDESQFNNGLYYGH